MSVDIQIRKFHNQFKNGVDLDANLTEFTHYLLGFVGQKMKRITQIAVQCTFQASASNTVKIVNGHNSMTRSSVSWNDDVCNIGVSIEFN